MHKLKHEIGVEGCNFEREVGMAGCELHEPGPLCCSLANTLLISRGPVSGLGGSSQKSSA